MRTFTATTVGAPAGVQHAKLKQLVAEIATLTQPEHIHWADGSEAEYQQLCAEMVRRGTLVPLNPALRKNSYLARSDASDVARVEDRTFICASQHTSVGRSQMLVRLTEEESTHG